MMILKQLQMQLESIADASSANQIVFPRREMMQRRLGRFYRKYQPLFPGYLFLLTPSQDKDLFRMLSRQPGVMQFLPGKGKIYPLSDEDIELIQPFLRNNGHVPLIAVEFNEKDLIVIKNGAFQGLEGRIIKVDRRRRRMKVSLSLYGDDRYIDFGYTDLNHTHG